MATIKPLYNVTALTYVAGRLPERERAGVWGLSQNVKAIRSLTTIIGLSMSIIYLLLK